MRERGRIENKTTLNAIYRKQVIIGSENNYELVFAKQNHFRFFHSHTCVQTYFLSSC